MQKIRTVEQAKANLTNDPKVKVDKKGIEYVTFGVAQNSDEGPAYASVVIYDKKAKEKAMHLKKGDFVRIYGKTQPQKEVTFFKGFNFRKFNKQEKPVVMPEEELNA